ncbi:hypothetical protein [Arthrobacter sp. B2a2-09]|uniref:hypothetical protein n=1 Tax=Arthrobacter sp. B2a2-09 TaxID=2952822 RepID=UPI0022CD5149|nr:hypothetical protein [Arthrobacter sp. B2a2-09]MCZ9880540.1 hypothetical protein [Arthrobacter sp. B2a2-09]
MQALIGCGWTGKLEDWLAHLPAKPIETDSVEAFVTKWFVGGDDQDVEMKRDLEALIATAERQSIIDSYEYLLEQASATDALGQLTAPWLIDKIRNDIQALKRALREGTATK